MTREYLKSIVAGALIGIGDIALLVVENKYIAAVLFSVALLSIIELKLPLYTGRIGKVFQNKNPVDCLAYLFGNSCGCIAVNALGVAILTSFSSQIKAFDFADAKYAKPFLTMFIAGILCNVLIHIAVTAKNEIITILCVMAFILCGFEHSIADVGFIIFTSGTNLLITLLKWVLVVLGNTVGGVATEFLIYKKEKTA